MFKSYSEFVNKEDRFFYLEIYIKPDLIVKETLISTGEI